MGDDQVIPTGGADPHKPSSSFANALDEQGQRMLPPAFVGEESYTVNDVYFPEVFSPPADDIDMVSLPCQQTGGLEHNRSGASGW
jgi:hypothetical protein